MYSKSRFSFLFLLYSLSYWLILDSSHTCVIWKESNAIIVMLHHGVLRVYSTNTTNVNMN